MPAPTRQVPRVIQRSWCFDEQLGRIIQRSKSNQTQHQFAADGTLFPGWTRSATTTAKIRSQKKDKKAAKMVDISDSILGSLALIQICPNFNPLSVAPRHMKTLRWFNRNRFFSVVRIASAGTLIAAAVVSGIALAFTPNPPSLHQFGRDVLIWRLDRLAQCRCRWGSA